MRREIGEIRERLYYARDNELGLEPFAVYVVEPMLERMGISKEDRQSAIDRYVKYIDTDKGIVVVYSEEGQNTQAEIEEDVVLGIYTDGETYRLYGRYEKRQGLDRLPCCEVGILECDELEIEAMEQREERYLRGVHAVKVARYEEKVKNKIVEWGEEIKDLMQLKGKEGTNIEVVNYIGGVTIEGWRDIFEGESEKDGLSETWLFQG